MATRFGTNHFSSWTAAFRYYERQDIDKEEVIDRVANGSIAIGPPNKAEGLRIVTDEDGRYYYEVRDYEIRIRKHQQSDEVLQRKIN